MKAAVIIKGKMVFLEGTVDEVCQCVEQLGLQEFQINFTQPFSEPQSWEKLRDYVKAAIEL
jgi:hypothetical protein